MRFIVDFRYKILINQLKYIISQDKNSQDKDSTSVCVVSLIVSEQDIKSNTRSLTATKFDDIDGLMSNHSLMIEVVTCISKPYGIRLMLVHR